MIPDLKRAVALNLAHDPIGCRNAVMRCLEDGGNILWNWDREDEEVYSMVSFAAIRSTNSEGVY